MADQLVAALQTVPGVEVEREDGRALDPQCIGIKATVRTVTVSMELNPRSSWGVIAAWYMASRSPWTFRDAFAHMVGGSINIHHRQKATGPFLPDNRTATPTQWRQFCEIVRMALLDVAQGGCIEVREAGQ